MKTCNSCGQNNLHWIEVAGRWQLFDQYKVKHVCGTKSEPKVSEPKDFRNDPKINKALKIFKEKLRNRNT